MGRVEGIGLEPNPITTAFSARSNGGLLGAQMAACSARSDDGLLGALRGALGELDELLAHGLQDEARADHAHAARQQARKQPRHALRLHDMPHRRAPIRILRVLLRAARQGAASAWGVIVVRQPVHSKSASERSGRLSRLTGAMARSALGQRALLRTVQQSS